MPHPSRSSALFVAAAGILLACRVAAGGRVATPTATASVTPSATGAGESGPPTANETRAPTQTSANTPGPSPETSTTPSSPDLNGVWEDNGHLIVIVQNGFRVSATYIEERVCDHQDGNGTTTRYRFDFVATLALEGDTWTLSGDEFGVCGYGHDDPSRNGLLLTQAQATISEDFNTISGDWYNSDLSDWVTGGVNVVRQFEAGAPMPTPTGFSLPTASP